MSKLKYNINVYTVPKGVIQQEEDEEVGFAPLESIRIVYTIDNKADADTLMCSDKYYRYEGDEVNIVRLSNSNIIEITVLRVWEASDEISH